MKIFITGGTGLIGKQLIKKLSARGDELTILTRNEGKAKRKLGDKHQYCTDIDSLISLDGYDAVINLAGEPITEKRWTQKQKEILCKSRWDVTSKLSDLIKRSTTPPYVFISGSAVGYYGSQDSEFLTEVNKSYGEFTYYLCKEWESLAMQAQSDKTRVCICRTGIVLSPNGGMLAKMLLPFRLGLGYVLGKGNQFVSWIHIEDMVRGLIFLLDHPHSEGVYNFTAPHPVANKVFSRTLARTLYRPCIIYIPSSVIQLVMGESSRLVLGGQRVVPRNLLSSGFKFKYLYLQETLEAILN